MRRAVMHRRFFTFAGPFDFGSFSVQVFELLVVLLTVDYRTASFTQFTAQFVIILSLMSGS